MSGTKSKDLMAWAVDQDGMYEVFTYYDEAKDRYESLRDGIKHFGQRDTSPRLVVLREVKPTRRKSNAKRRRRTGRARNAR